MAKVAQCLGNSSAQKFISMKNDADFLGEYWRRGASADIKKKILSACLHGKKVISKKTLNFGLKICLVKNA
jgi:hypothetical protein